jgi:hypothetical protein
MKITPFWDIAPCCLVEVGRRFRGAYCSIRVMVAAVRTFKTSVYFNETTRHYITESCHLQPMKTLTYQDSDSQKKNRIMHDNLCFVSHM